MLDRRTLLGGAALAGLATLGGCSARSAMAGTAIAAETVELAVGDGRTGTASLWAPAAPTAVAVFSHGYNSWPERYADLAMRMAGDGIAVIAPTHRDSLQAPGGGAVPPQEAFMTRIADFAAASAYLRTRFGDLPLLAAGHSFGSLISMCAAGALSGMTGFQDEAVDAVLAFSTPGLVPGLVTPDAFAAVRAPMLLVTGTQDTVANFVSDPQDHLVPPRQTSGPSYALMVAGADHSLAGEPDRLTQVWPLVDAFLGSALWHRAGADRHLAAWRAAPEDTYIVKDAS